MIDVHLHSKFSFDSNENPENYVKKASLLGINVVGFSEHYDYDAFLDGEKEVTLLNVSEYIKNCNALRKEYNVDILQGIEVGYRKEATEHYQTLFEKYSFDYIINSLHTLPNRGDCYHDAFFSGKSLKECYKSYLLGVLESVYADYDYQIVGHIGYASRYRNGDGARILYSDFDNLFDDILFAIISKDKCLEINTSSGSGGCEFLPDKDVIRRHVDMGGKLISFGSDAHIAENYRRNADALKTYLKSLGIKELYYYKQKKPIAYEI